MPPGLRNAPQMTSTSVKVFWGKPFFNGLDANCSPSGPQKAQSTSKSLKIRRINVRNHETSGPEPMTNWKKKHHRNKMWQWFSLWTAPDTADPKEQCKPQSQQKRMQSLQIWLESSYSSTLSRLTFLPICCMDVVFLSASKRLPPCCRRLFLFLPPPMPSTFAFKFLVFELLFAELSA